MPPGFEGGAGAILMAKDVALPINPGGHAYWGGTGLLVIEAQGYGHKALGHLDDQYAIWLARHHFEGVPLDKGIRDQCLKTWWVQVRASLGAAGIHIPGGNPPAGAKLPDQVDLVFEQPYAPKANCTGHRRQEKRKKFDNSPESAPVWSDCFAREMTKPACNDATKQATALSMTCSMSDAEADGTLAERLAVHGATVVVASGDGDIFMYPLGRKPWKLVYPTKRKEQVRVLDWKHKLRAMAALFKVPEDRVGKNYDRAEVLYLSVAMLNPHDYHYGKGDDGIYTGGKTNVGAGSWPVLMELVGRELVDGLGVRNGSYKPVVVEVYDLIKLVKAHPNNYGKAQVKAANRCSADLLDKAAPAGVAAFLDQPVSHKPGSLTSVPYYRHFVDQSVAPKTTQLSFDTFVYEGKCDDCPAEYEQRWEPAEALKRAQPLKDDEWGGAKVKAPKLLMSDVIKVVEAYRHKAEFGDSQKTQTALDLVLGLMGRASYTHPDVSVATIDPQIADQVGEWPEDVPKSVGGAATLIFVVTGLAIQSYGIGAYTKTEHRAGQHYRTSFALLCDKATGRFITADGPGLDGTGWLGAWCRGCLSPFELDQHVISAMIFTSKFDGLGLHSSTDAVKYWRQQDPRSSGLPKLVKECQVTALYVSDVMKRRVTDEEALKWLMGSVTLAHPAVLPMLF